MILQGVGKGSKAKLYFYIAVVQLFLSIGYIIYVQKRFKAYKSSEQRCLSELSSVKVQLQAVSEYKNNLDLILKESKIKQETQNRDYKDFLENCSAMKQQAVICQNQFEDLQFECKKVKEKYDSLVAKEMDKPKPNK